LPFSQFLFFKILEHYIKNGSLAIFAPKSPKGDLLPLFATNNAVAVPFRDGRAKIVKEPKKLR